MKLSKSAFNEILTKCKKRFPSQVGSSIDAGDSWEKFCAKNPIEFRGDINGAKVVLRINSDGYAIHQSNSYSFFKIYGFGFEK